MTIEEQLYDTREYWDADRYLANESERKRFETCVNLVPHDAASLLDVGTGNGAFLRFLEERRPEISVTGVERARAAIDAALCHAEIRQGSIDRLPFETGSFDVVTALEVVEHLPFKTYGSALRELERVARKWIIVSVPFRENRLYVRCPYCNCEFNPHFHMQTFDEGRMAKLMPTFSCVQHQKIRSPYIVGGELVAPMYRWLRKQLGFFPPHAMCPQCGFSRNEHRPASVAGPDRTETALRTGQLLRRSLPKRERAKWIVGLYKSKL